MRYWALSSLARNPQIPGHLQYELLGPHWLISPNAMNAAAYVASGLPPAIPHGLTCIESVGAPVRRIFTDYPLDDEFERLEPAGVMEDCNGMYYLIHDCFH